MKNIVYIYSKALILSIWIFLGNTGFSQGVDTIGADFEIGVRKPLRIDKGTQFFVATDSVFLINANRIAFYKDLSEAISSNDDECVQLLDETVKRYESTLGNYDRLFDDLAKNATSADNISRNLINRVGDSVATANTSLIHLQSSLIAVNQELANAQKSIKKAKWQNKGKLFGVAAGGIGVGLLIGLISN